MVEEAEFRRVLENKMRLSIGYAGLNRAYKDVFRLREGHYSK